MTDGRQASPRPVQPTDVEVGRRRAFGRRLRELRRSHGWAQDELAERSGVTADVLRGIELGERTVRLDAIWRLADALGCQPGDLLHRDDRAAGD